MSALERPLRVRFTDETRPCLFHQAKGYECRSPTHYTLNGKPACVPHLVRRAAPVMRVPRAIVAAFHARRKARARRGGTL